MITHVKDCRLNNVVKFKVSVPSDTTLYSCSKEAGFREAFSFWREEINEGNFSFHVKGGIYNAHVCSLSLPTHTMMSAFSLITVIKSHGGIGVGACGGALAVLQSEQKLPQSYILCPDEVENLWKDKEGNVRLPRLCPNLSSWDFNLDFNHRNDLSNQFVLFFCPTS